VFTLATLNFFLFCLVSQKVGFPCVLLWEDCEVDSDLFEALPTESNLSILEVKGEKDENVQPSESLC
jgi:hypothetical protein